MKEILLSQGKVAIVDDQDYEIISPYKWTASRSRNTFYASRKVTRDGKRIRIWMHRIIIDAPSTDLVDHKDGNGLNNTRNNLRRCNSSQNNANRIARGLSRFKGVCKTQIKKTNKSGTTRTYQYWQASIQIGNNSKILGRFKREEEAANAYNKAALEKYGEFAKLNIIS